MNQIVMLHVGSETLLSDMFKDAHGFRPRDTYPEYMDEASVNKEYARLEALIVEDIQRERVAQLANQREYETYLTTLQEQFGIDRYTAIRWDHEANEDMLDPGDFSYWIYNRGMSYDLTDTYRAEFRAAGIF